MSWIRTIFREIFGLFVDDGSFAILILLWLAVGWLFLRSPHLASAGGVLLFLGLAVVLVESATRFARKRS